MQTRLHRSTRWFLWLLLFWGCVSSAWAAAERQFAYLPVYSQPAADLVEVLRPMVGAGSLVAHRDQLIVHGTAAEIAAVSAALERLDRPPRSLMIEIRLADQARRTGRDSYLSGSWQRGEDQEQVRIDLGGREIRTQRRDDLVQRVQALDGRPALIRTGEWRPVTDWVGVWPDRRGAVLGRTDYQSVDSGFYAIARTHGDEVTVELSQQHERPLPNGAVSGGSAQTVVRGRLGEWLDIGGQQQAEQAGVRRWSTDNVDERRLQLRVQVLGE